MIAPPHTQAITSAALATSVSATMLAIVTVLLVVSLAVGYRYRQDRARYRDLACRTLSWYPVILTFLAGLIGGREAFTALFIALSVRVLVELERLRPAPTARSRSMALGLASVALFYGLLCSGRWAEALGVPAIAATLWLFSGRRDRTTRGVMLTTGALGSMPALWWSPMAPGPRGWEGILLFVLLITQAHDIAQYAWGRRLGRRPLAPQTSPNKTWEGLLGGLLTMSLLGAPLAMILTPMRPAQGAAAALMLSLLGVLGDLWMSALKRRAGLKDFGALLPGFGGVLDRIDSLILVGPPCLLICWSLLP